MKSRLNTKIFAFGFLKKAIGTKPIICLLHFKWVPPDERTIKFIKDKIIRICRKLLCFTYHFIMIKYLLSFRETFCCFVMRINQVICLSVTSWCQRHDSNEACKSFFFLFFSKYDKNKYRGQLGTIRCKYHRTIRIVKPELGSAGFKL